MEVLVAGVVRSGLMHAAKVISKFSGVSRVVVVSFPQAKAEHAVFENGNASVGDFLQQWGKDAFVDRTVMAGGSNGMPDLKVVAPFAERVVWMTRDLSIVRRSITKSGGMANLVYGRDVGMYSYWCEHAISSRGQGWFGLSYEAMVTHPRAVMENLASMLGVKFGCSSCTDELVDHNPRHLNMTEKL